MPEGHTVHRLARSARTLTGAQLASLWSDAAALMRLGERLGGS